MGHFIRCISVLQFAFDSGAPRVLQCQSFAFFFLWVGVVFANAPGLLEHRNVCGRGGVGLVAE